MSGLAATNYFKIFNQFIIHYYPYQPTLYNLGYSRLGTGYKLDNQEIGFPFPAEERGFLFSTVSRPAQVFTQPPIQCEPEDITDL
jgi:hypothetical protein